LKRLLHLINAGADKTKLVNLRRFYTLRQDGLVLNGKMMLFKRIAILQVLILFSFCSTALSQNSSKEYSYNSYGAVGILDLPNALNAERDEIAASFSRFSGGTRSSLTYQATNNLSLTFRYSKIDRYSSGQATFDRSFDVKYRLLDETRLRPAVAIGVNDIIGTGLFSSEYIVATKSVAPSINVTAGLGWGRLAGRNSFENPLSALFGYGANRASRDAGQGGKASLTTLFTGDASIFGGVEWAVSPKLGLKLEYSPDLYSIETRPGTDLFENRTPINIGLSYAPNKNTDMQLYYMHGSSVGVSLNYRFNPRKPLIAGGNGTAPLPVLPRPKNPKKAASWTLLSTPDTSIKTRLEKLLEGDRIDLKSYSIDGSIASVAIENNGFNSQPQAIGRTMRALSHVVPAHVDKFVVVPVRGGIPMSKIVVDRSSVEEFEFPIHRSGDFLSHVLIEDASDFDVGPLSELNRFEWSLKPYVSGSYFDPENPVRLDFGAELSANYSFTPNLVLSGRARKKIFGNRDQSTRSDFSSLPRVRSDANLYAKADFSIPELSLTYNFRPGPDLYSRISVGYLESMFGGISAETIWKPVHSDLAFGATVSHVRQREFNQLLGFRNYSVLTGHATIYKDFSNGYSAQFDAGRYLAGDWGGTLSIARRYSNGWEIGAYMTLTDVSFDDFGEGSFDKGIRFTVPLEQILGKPTPSKRNLLIQPVLRDGGAKLYSKDPLHAEIREYHKSELKRGWGRFWR
jgi:hypothetical protein